MPKPMRKKKIKGVRTGKLRIADHWNAISIIAKSQANPLKAVAEFVENSIDAGARQIVIVRGKKKSEFNLKVSDDGEGIPKNEQGIANNNASNINFRKLVNIRSEMPIKRFGRICFC
jgi:hypothetical protein